MSDLRKDVKEYDVVIIGAGPSGIQSAIELQNRDLKIALLDDSFKLGGQIYKNVQNNDTKEKRKLFQEDYYKGLKLIQKLDLSSIDYISSASIWSINDSMVFYSKNNVSTRIRAKKTIIAVGAMERPFPIEGWTLPGVMGATSAQIMLKESSVVKNDAVFVGTGPLFYYVIAQYIDAGANIKAIIDTTPAKNYIKALKYLPKALMKLPYLLKGLGFLYKFKKHKIKMYKFADDIKFEGDESLFDADKTLKRVSFKDGTSIDTSIAFIHNGLAPNINLQLQAGCEYEFSKKTRTINIITNEYMESSVENIFVIGDGKSVRGVDTATTEAKIAATKILKDFNKLEEKIISNKFLTYSKELKSHSHMRDFLDELYLPNTNFLSPSKDEVVVCRCEEVTFSAVKSSLEIDCKGINSVKSFTRCGMGNCQGRFCGLTLLEIMSEKTNIDIEELNYLKIRSPIKPVRIEEMANIK